MRRALFIVALGCASCGQVGRPTANPGPLQRTAKAGEMLTFDGSASKGSITKYTWDFGDGSATVEEKTTTHAYATNGDYSATLTVRGPGGAHSASVLVNVGTGCSATAMINVQTADPQPNAVVLFGSTGSTGCMGAALATYEWDFGDGSALVSGDSSKASVAHTYTTLGTYLVKLRVVDANENEGRASRSLGVGVVNTGKPLVTCPQSLSGEVSRPITFSANASDPGGMSVTYAWTFSDSTTGTGPTVMKTFSTMGSFTSTVVATTTDSRMSDPCTTNVTVTAPRNYTGNWLVSPTGSSFNGNCPFTVQFPTASLALYHRPNPDGGQSLITVTPNGGSYPGGYEMNGSEEPPPAAAGTFYLRRDTPNENPNSGTCPGQSGTCSMNFTTSHTLRMTFTSATLVTGTWSKTYDGCTTSQCACCNCLAGGSTAGAFNGVKQ